MKSGTQQKFCDLLNLFERGEELGQPLPNHLAEQIDLYHKVYCELPQNIAGSSRERFMLLTYLEAARLTVTQSDLNAAFSGSDNVFEIYGLNFAQIYRSLSFMQFKTYSLLTLMTKSNFELYSREQGHAEKVLEQVSAFLAGGMKTTRFDIPIHKVWEKAEPYNHSYHWLMNLGLIAPVYSVISGEPAGLLVSHRTKQIFRSPFLELIHDASGQF